MGYILRVRLASFFAGAAAASFAGLYILRRDYKIAHESISHQREVVEGRRSLPKRILEHVFVLSFVIFFYNYEEAMIKGIHASLDSRLSALEKINHDEASQNVQVQAAE